jgi:hypothetical protein
MRPQFWIATLSYRYDNMELTAAQRYINRLGFRVYSYRVNAESLPVGEPIMNLKFAIATALAAALVSAPALASTRRQTAPTTIGSRR